MISLNAISKTLPGADGPLHILKPLTLEVEAGEFMAIMGPSGSGKSTLLGLLAGLDNPSGGSVSINGQSLTDMNEDALALFRGRNIGFVFQAFHLIPSLTALENVQVPMEILGLPGAEKRGRDLLAQVGLETRMTHYPAQLSGGEQQRVAIARAFSCAPPVLLADEPTGNLDSATGHNMIELLKNLHAEEKTTCLLVTHDPEVAGAAKRILKLKDGAVIEDTKGAA